MKKFFILAMVMTIIVFARFTFADINITGHGETGLKSPVFEQENSPSGNMLSFEYNQTSDGDASSLGTCAMNPQGSGNYEAIIEELPLIEPDTYVPITDVAGALIADNSQPSNSDNPSNPDYPYPPAPPQSAPPTVTPEPATILVIAFGLVGLTPLVRRYRQKEINK